jgi:hypothetical protein
MAIGHGSSCFASSKSDSPMSAAYLDKLNPDQRRAVEHGVCEHGACDPATDAAPACW